MAEDSLNSSGIPYQMLWYQFDIFDVYLAVGRYQEVIGLSTVPIFVHHGNLDEEVPPELSAWLWQTMQVANLPGEYYTYLDQGHFFVGPAWGLVMERALAFFDRYVR